MHKRCKYIYLKCQKRILLPKVCRYIWLCITKLRFMEKDKSKTVLTWCRYIRPENKLHVYLMYVGTPGKQVMWRLVNHRLMQERRPNLIGSWSTEKKILKTLLLLQRPFLKHITYVCFSYITLLVLISWLGMSAILTNCRPCRLKLAESDQGFLVHSRLVADRVITSFVIDRKMIEEICYCVHTRIVML